MVHHDILYIMPVGVLRASTSSSRLPEIDVFSLAAYRRRQQQELQ